MEQCRNKRHHQRNTGERTCGLFNIGLIAKVAQQESEYPARDPHPKLLEEEDAAKRQPGNAQTGFLLSIIHRFGDRGPEHRHLHIAEEINKKIERKRQDKIFTPDGEIHQRAQDKGNNLGVAEHLNFVPELGYPGGGDHR